MSDHTCTLVEPAGSSPPCVDDASRKANGSEAGALRHDRWLELTGVRGHLVEGKVACVRGQSNAGFGAQD